MPFRNGSHTLAATSYNNLENTQFMLDAISRDTLSIFALLIVAIAICSILAIAILYVIDIKQNQDAVRRNYPVIGRFRYIFEHLGEFFRQYFFAMDREEMPFNRAIRNWIYRASKNESLSNAFGSTHDAHKEGSTIFLNAAYPKLDSEISDSPPIIVGAECTYPYQAPSFFNISAMSYGALSKVAVQALSKGAAKAKCWLNTGEGGLSPHHLAANCDIVFQLGTARYGVRDQDGNFSDDKFKKLIAHPQIKMVEIKLSQGAKPGKGGILPADKVTAEIAEIRGIPQGQASLSPNRHPGIGNDQQLLDFVAHLKKLCGKPVGIKFVLGQAQWLDELLPAINARPRIDAPDFITLDGGDGGSGAAPQPLMDFVGLPISSSLPLLISALKKYKLRERIRVVVAGKLVSPGSIAEALANGADFVNSARGFMFALGCIQAMKCNKNTCPTGITTHDKKLQRGLDPTDKSNRVAYYHKNLTDSVEMIAHSCGVSCAKALSTSHYKIVTFSNNSCSE